MSDKILEAFDGTRKAGAIASGALDEVAKKSLQGDLKRN